MGLCLLVDTWQGGTIFLTWMTDLYVSYQADRWGNFHASGWLKECIDQASDEWIATGKRWFLHLYASTWLPHLYYVSSHSPSSEVTLPGPRERWEVQSFNREFSVLFSASSLQFVHHSESALSYTLYNLTCLHHKVNCKLALRALWLRDTFWDTPK